LERLKSTLLAQPARPLQALEIGLAGVGALYQAVLIGVERVRVVAAIPAGKEAAGQRRPGEHGHLLAGVPVALARLGGAADRQRVGPRRLELLGQAELRAAGHE